MFSRTTKIITGMVGAILLCTFIIGLSHSISIGFAGFWGGLPFVIIIMSILPMAIYDFWDECVRDQKNNA